MRAVTTLLALGLLLMPPPWSGPLRAEEAPPTPEAIDRALERAVDWLLHERKPDRTWGDAGPSALVLFTLLDAGLPPGDKAFRSRRLGKLILSRHIDRTYDAALLVLVGRDAPEIVPPAEMRRLVGLLEEGQAQNGQWSYGLDRKEGVGDNSNSQFAVLALGAATGCGIQVDPEVLARAWRWWRAAQAKDGGFGYASGGSSASQPTGSMTAAAIASLAILEAALQGKVPTLDGDSAGDTGRSRALDRAVKRLGRDFRVDRNFGPAQGKVRQKQRKSGRGWLHYYLWSVERAMVLAGHERLEGRDWYGEGARQLLATQKKDGSWRGSRPLYATCFAVLFLARAADPPRAFTPTPPAPTTRTPATPGPTPATATKVKPAPQASGIAAPDADLDALQEAYLEADPLALLDLVRALDDRDRDARRRAAALLRRLLGDEVFGRADRHPLARGRLHLWIRRNARFLERDGSRFTPKGA